MQITVEGRPHLGAPLGCSAYVNQFVSQKVQQWSTELRVLSEITSTQSHAAFAALTLGLSNKWSYVIRTTPSIGHLLQPLDAILRSTLIPNLTGRPPPNDIDLRLFALPARLGGLGITCSQDHVYSFAALDCQMSTRADIHWERRQQVRLEADSLRDNLTPTLQRAMNLACEHCSLSWLTSLPIMQGTWLLPS